MRKVSNLLLSSAMALALTAFASANAQAQEHMKPQGKQVTLNVQVIDLHCFTANGMKGEMHKECNIACSKAGVPLALLTSDGKVYIPVAKSPMTSQQNYNKQLVDYAEQWVKVEGTLYESGGVLGIDITGVEAAAD